MDMSKCVICATVQAVPRQVILRGAVATCMWPFRHIHGRWAGRSIQRHMEVQMKTVSTIESRIIVLSNSDVNKMLDLPEGSEVVRVVYDAFEPAEMLTFEVVRQL